MKNGISVKYSSNGVLHNSQVSRLLRVRTNELGFMFDSVRAMGIISQSKTAIV